MYGRPLDIAREDQAIDGKVSEIYISRYALVDDCVDELLHLKEEDFRVPLDVCFVGEEAKDYGGLRREFLSLALQAFQNTLFEETEDGFILVENAVHLVKKHYFVAGLVLGMLCTSDTFSLK